jgi:hypothetical protein
MSVNVPVDTHTEAIPLGDIGMAPATLRVTVDRSVNAGAHVISWSVPITLPPSTHTQPVSLDGLPKELESRGAEGDDALGSTAEKPQVVLPAGSCNLYLFPTVKPAPSADDPEPKGAPASPDGLRALRHILLHLAEHSEDFDVSGRARPPNANPPPTSPKSPDACPDGPLKLAHYVTRTTTGLRPLVCMCRNPPTDPAHRIQTRWARFRSTR